MVVMAVADKSKSHPDFPSAADSSEYNDTKVRSAGRDIRSRSQCPQQA
jgi:hypothetical protein